MSYSIETRTVTEFITDNSIRLPRFQRKSTWKPGQNFELAISMFKEYPLGVVVINDERGTSWLLDGRQRRTALKDLRDNPDKVYDAAKSYIKFSPSESEDELKRKYWEKVGSYLINYANNSEEQDKGDDWDEEEETSEEDINRERQTEGLNVLLDIILMVHRKIKDKNSGLMYGKWERLFKLDAYLNALSYAPKKHNYAINPVLLHEFLLTTGEKAQSSELTADYFYESVEEKIKDGQEEAFRAYITQWWPDMKKVIEVVMRSEEIFKRSRIGVISIKNVSPLDAQNIFSRINSGGTPLTSEELISAKPFWNESVIGCSAEVERLVTDLYKRLDVTVPAEGKIVRWDLVATIMSRIKDGGLLFEDYQSLSKQAAGSSKFPEISIGFRLIASYFMKGVAKVHINALELNKNIQWPRSIDMFVEDYNRFCAVLLQEEFFKSLVLWKRPLIKLIGASATFEFCSILFSEWKRLGEPVNHSTERNTFFRNAKILFDRLLFEYATGFWRGSGDSKMSKHLREPQGRFEMLSADAWSSFIQQICTDGRYNGQIVPRANLEPLIYYQFALRKIYHPMDHARYEIDHIIPQSQLKNNSSVPAWFMDSLINLSILPREDNNAKKDNPLSSLKNSVCANTVSQFTGISTNDFDKFSDLSNIDKLIRIRKDLLLDAFTQKRPTHLAQ